MRAHQLLKCRQASRPMRSSVLAVRQRRNKHIIRGMKGKRVIVRRTGRARPYWAPRVAAIRVRTGMSQREFAKLIGVSVDTLQNWEQGRRQPSGPAVVLLRVLEHDAESVMRGRTWT
jgi:putative transcriptional regulator